MDIERLFDERAEKKQDERAEESLNKLGSYLNTGTDNNSNTDYNIDTKGEQDNDYLNNIAEDDGVKIEDLKKLIGQLKDLYEVPTEENGLSETQGQSTSNGKVLTKSLKGFKNAEQSTDSTAKEIASSFINCFILCMVTALMGTGWFIYIINHI